MGRFILIDHSLVDFSGHHYEYARGVLDAAAEAGFDPVLVANRRFKTDRREAWPIVPGYKYGVWLHQGPLWQRRMQATAGWLRRFRRPAGKRDAMDRRAQLRVPDRGAALRAWLRAGQSEQFVRDTRRVLGPMRLVADDLVLIPTLSFDDFLGLRRSWPAPGAPRGADWHFVFRRDVPEEPGAEAVRFRAAFERRRAIDGESRWSFWTDSEELTERYRAATGCSFGTLPIPHVAPSPAHAARGACRILCLGDARSEKGFQHLPGLVKALGGDLDRRFEFTIQAHTTAPAVEPEVSAARRELARLAPRGVALCHRALTHDEYRELLARGDLCVLLYDSAAYAARSSGVFVDALAAGIPMIVPADTWMARRLPAGAGLTFRSPDEAPSLIRQIAAGLSTYRDAAKRHSLAWGRRHNARELVSQLMAGVQTRSPELMS